MTDVRAPLAGALGDRYELQGEIGSGGMATVYRALDHKLGRQVAVKVLHPELAPLLGSGRFRREIEIAAALQHPNIVPLFESGGEGSVLYYTMPFIEGETLRARIEREQQLPVEEAVRIAEEVAAALAHAHAQGIVHRDIKPENILLSGGRAVVADFGIARAVSAAGEDRLTSAGIAVGTPAYMSPEQAGGQTEVDGRADIYALGCVVFEMLSGEPPFTGRTPQAVLARHLQEGPPSLRVVRNTVSWSLQQVIEKALAKSPADRYQTADAMAGALRAALRRAPGGRRGAPWRTVALAGGPLLLAAAAIWGWRALAAARAGLDPQKVVVFPLQQRGPWESGAQTGQLVALMIGAAFEQAEPLKWIDAWSWLDAATRRDIARLTSAEARRIARARRARYYVEGDAARVGDSVAVILRLNDVRGDSVVATRSASGRLDAVAHLGLRAAALLLPALVEPRRAEAVNAFANRNPLALAHWLEGEREYRQSHYTAALEHDRRALAADSLLAVAALRGAQAANWAARDSEALVLADLAVRRRSDLPPKYAHFAVGFREYLIGDADSAVVELERARALDSAWSEPWTALGEVYYHEFPRQLAAPAAADSAAESLFRVARRLDPGVAPPILHLGEIALRRGDPAEARRLLREFGDVQPEGPWLAQLRIMTTCVADGPDAVDWRAAVAQSAQAVMLAARELALQPPYESCALAGFQAAWSAPTSDPGTRWGALFGLHALARLQGHERRARALLDTAVATGLPAAYGLYVVDAVLGAPGVDSQAGAVIASLAGDYRRMGPIRLWYHGVWQAHLGNRSELERIVGAADRLDADRGGITHLVRTALGARLALLRADTARAIALLAALRPAGRPADIGWECWAAIGIERMMLARLLEARGDREGAARSAAHLDQPQPMFFVTLQAESLALRERLAEAQGRPAEAARYRARLQAIRDAARRSAA